MIPVVVGTNPERRDWARDCIRSIRATSRWRRVVVHDSGGFEITALRTGIAHFDKFLFLHDSCEVLSTEFWEIIDSCEPSWLFGGPPMYLAVYDSINLSSAIEDAPTPSEMTKRWALSWESALGDRLPMPTLWPEVTDATGYQQERHGRHNLVLENSYLRKWKGHWGQGGPDL